MLHRPLSILLLAVSLPAIPLHAEATARLVTDLNPSRPLNLNGSMGVQEPLVPLGSKVFFSGSEPSSGSELWVSDGTPLGTALVSDLCAGSCSSNPKLLGPTGKAVVFLTLLDSPDFPVGDLWRSDGTRAGTFLIKGAVAPCSPTHTQASALGGVVVFVAYAGSGCSLWRTDGTPGGTAQLPGVFSPIGSPLVEGPVAAGNALFFLVDSGSTVRLLRTDADATHVVELGRFFFDPENDLKPRLLTALGSRVFFLARGETGDEELWTSDGTFAGTRAVTRFLPPSPFGSTLFLKALGDAVYFVADDGAHGAELWRSDGTAAGTQRVTDLAHALPFGDSGNTVVGAAQISKAGGRVVFIARDGAGQWRLWTSGGTPATTAPLAGCPGGCPSVTPLTLLAASGNRVVFSAAGLGQHIGLWSSDGTSAGTRLVRDVCSGACGSQPVALLPALGKLFFLSSALDEGERLWATDGTARGTLPLADLGPRPFNPSTARPFSLVASGARVFFGDGDPQLGRQLWTSDGTPQGTGLVAVMDSGAGSALRGLTAFGNGLMFGACDGQIVSLWRSDGTEAGTKPVVPTQLSCFGPKPPRDLTVAGGLLYFFEGDSLERLWRSDGTDAGTFPVTPEEGLVFGSPVAFRGKAVLFFRPLDSSVPVSLWESDGTVAGTRALFDLPSIPYSALGLRALGQDLYFVARSNSAGDQLWVSDGTAAGTVALTDFETALFGSFEPPEMAIVGDTVFFVNGYGPRMELWKTDGTAAGTAAVPRSSPNGEGLHPTNLTVFQGALYFIGDTGQGGVGRGLFRSDGTAGGTVLVAPVGLAFDTAYGSPGFTVLGNQLFFVAADGEHGVELWRTDGTAAGTFLVRDIFPGSASSQPQSLTAAGGRLFFSADDGVHGLELWESDGTVAGTRIVQDIAPGALPSNPAELSAAGGQLFFHADDGVHGDELWALDLTGAPGCQPSDQVLCLGGGRFRVEASWQDSQGQLGRGHAVSMTADTGTFWFFDRANVEVVLKTLDGRGVNGNFWVFYGALSNVEYDLTVTDTQTGAARLYRNPRGHLASVADTQAFGPLGANRPGLTLGPSGVSVDPLVAESRATAPPGCTPTASRLCIQGGRFAITASWRDFQGHTGVGTAVPLAGGTTGTFWFFNAENVEVILKILDGRPVNGKFWVFYGALSNVEYTLTVTDTQTGKMKSYLNPIGRLASVADTAAF